MAKFIEYSRHDYRGYLRIGRVKASLDLWGGTWLAVGVLSLLISFGTVAMMGGSPNGMFPTGIYLALSALILLLWGLIALCQAWWAVIKKAL